MRYHFQLVRRYWITALGFTCFAALSTGCRTAQAPAASEFMARDAIERYCAEQADQLAHADRSPAAPYTPLLNDCARSYDDEEPRASARAVLRTPNRRNIAHGHLAGIFDNTILTLCTFGEEDETAASQPTTQAALPPRGLKPAAPPVTGEFVPPQGYWRRNIWHQMGHESKALGGHDFWKGFETSFWDLDNALLLTATMGASITIRETGVDHTIRARTRGHRQLGDLDETVQVLGHPGTHFAATGVLWLTSALTKDVKEHELAKSLTQALAVNGVTTLALKAAANTRTPDNERHGWPSGHASSTFAAAAVLNEYYGPWVGVPCLALAGLVGYQRLDSRVHDISDVVFGGMLGYVIGTSIAREEQAQFPELFGMQVIPYVDPETGATGLALMKRW